jgi:hypothetical protein
VQTFIIEDSAQVLNGCVQENPCTTISCFLVFSRRPVLAGVARKRVPSPTTGPFGGLHDMIRNPPSGGCCPNGTSRHNAPRVKECHAGACRGRIIPLLLDMCRCVSEQGDLSAARRAVLGYMRAYLGVARAVINLRDQETGCTFIHRSLGITEVEERPARRGCGGPDRWEELARQLSDCRALVAQAAGETPRKVLAEGGLDLVVASGTVKDALRAIYGECGAVARKSFGNVAGEHSVKL